ncbi:unnamed protein product [Rhizoctonia solani]|uniref:Uncharacterized protein n=1 Tax=Rhizoctonia solani TaxID=456999 RepID=A0A8H3C8L0_9AGAM|nr:unnamed protein product [Rhizoctonia solani]
MGCENHRRLAFSATNSQVFFADDWDRSAVKSVSKLSYSDVLELKQLSLELPPDDRHASMGLSPLCLCAVCVRRREDRPVSVQFVAPVPVRAPPLPEPGLESRPIPHLSITPVSDISTLGYVDPYSQIRESNE